MILVFLWVFLWILVGIFLWIFSFYLFKNLNVLPGIGAPPFVETGTDRPHGVLVQPVFLPEPEVAPLLHLPVIDVQGGLEILLVVLSRGKRMVELEKSWMSCSSCSGESTYSSSGTGLRGSRLCITESARNTSALRPMSFTGV